MGFTFLGKFELVVFFEILGVVGKGFDIVFLDFFVESLCYNQ